MKKNNNDFFLTFLKRMGIDLRTFTTFILNYPDYLRDFKKFKKLQGDDTNFVVKRSLPMLNDKKSPAGVLSGAYFHQDLLVAQRILRNNPEKHVDIGSRIDGFVAHVAVSRKIEVLDIRNQVSLVKNIQFRQADLMNLPDNMKNYCDSISSLHAIEHFGLGRYGDPLVYEGHISAIKNIATILKSGGKFYFSTPIGPQRVEFNAHRVFSVKYLKKLLEEFFLVDHLSVVRDDGSLSEDVELREDLIDSNYDCNYGCGIWELSRK